VNGGVRGQKLTTKLSETKESQGTRNREPLALNMKKIQNFTVFITNMFNKIKKNKTNMILLF